MGFGAGGGGGAGVGVGVGCGSSVGAGVEKVTSSPVDSGLQGQGSVADGFTDQSVAFPSPHWQYSLGTLGCFGAALVYSVSGSSPLPIAFRLTRKYRKGLFLSFCILGHC